MSDTQQKSGAKRSGTMAIANGLAIVGSIILVVIIIWGLIHLLSLSGGFFSSLFGGDSNKITVSAPAEVTSGRPVNISWKHSTKDKGMYALIYPCAEGLRFSAPGPDDAFVTMPCGAAFSIGASTSTARILPMLVGTTSVKTPFSVVFIPSSTTTAPVEGTVTMRVVPALVGTPAPAATATTTPPVKPTEPAKPAPATPKPATPSASGPGDLAVTITSVSIDQWGQGTVTFHISNIGSGNSGSYQFTAQLPTAQPYTYNSPVQSSLSPGSYIINTLRFTQAAPGQVSIFVDPANAAAESNEGNNIASQYISGSYPYNYQYDPTYQPGYYDIYNYPYVY